MITFRHLLAHSAALALTLIARGEPFPSILKHSIPAPPIGVQAEAQFGTSVATDGAFMAVGAPKDRDSANVGSVKIFDSSSGALLRVLRNPNPGLAFFGQSVAISGTRVVVGAYRDDTEATDTGRAYVFDLASANPTVPVVTLIKPRPGEGDEFGVSVAISGNRVVVGARFNDYGAPKSGTVYVFDLASQTPTVPVATLYNPQPASDDYFGNAVDISGSRVVVGAHLDDTTATNAGSIYVYDLAGASPTVPLTINNPTSGTVQFGLSVAIDGTKVVAGSPSHHDGNVYAGRVDVFDVASATPSVPVITLNNPAPGDDAYGYDVDISGTRIVVGAPRDDLPDGQGNDGSAYVYDLASATPSVPVATLNNPTPFASQDLFGNSVAISETRVLVGAMDDNGAPQTGNAYFYSLTGGAPTVPTGILGTPSPSAEDSFGCSIAASGNFVVVGATGDPTVPSASGSVSVYDLAGTSPTVPFLTIPDPDPDSYGGFGLSVAISGSRIVVGTSANRVHVFDISSASPTVPVASFAPAGTFQFGCSVGISGTRIVVGDKKDILGSDYAGKVFVFDLVSPTPTEPVLVLNNPDASQSDSFGPSFGNAVAISGLRIVVGAEADDVELAGVGNVTNAGSVYVYDLDSLTPATPIATFRNPVPGAFDFFGHSVAFSGTRIAVGAYQKDTGASNSGTVYVYDLSNPTAGALIATLHNPTPTANQWFGQSVALSGPIVVAGTRGLDAGIAYVFDLNNGAPTTPVATLNNPTGTSQELFGSAVAMVGSTAIVGAPFRDSPQLNKGAVYVFVSDELITQVPALIAPVADSLTNSPVSVAFQLPEAALPESLRLTFTGAVTRMLTLASSQETAGLHEFVFDPRSPTSPEIASGDPIPDGTYTVTISYRDLLGNAAGTATSANVTIDATAPVLSGQFSPLIVSEGTLPNYLSQTNVADASPIVELTQQPPAGSPTAAGMVTVILKAKDAAGNEGIRSLGIAVRPAMPVMAAHRSQGDDVPGAGTPNGPPPGAKLASFGVPAIDAEGHVAFSARWTSGDGNGSGIFRDDAFVSKVGGDVPGLSGATFKSLTEPVIDAGRVAFLGTAAGVPRAQSSVVVTDVTGTLETVAQSGLAAPGTGDATFKSFKSISVSGNAVGVLAQLTPGTGATRTTTANDLGLWVKEGANPFVLALREGQEVAPGKKIKTLVSFAGGNGSPGQGRGWLVDTGSNAQVLALTTLSDKSQAIIAVALDDLANPAILVQSGAGSTFATLGLPTTNASAQTVFLGSLVLGDEVTKANSRGIFADLDGSGTYSTIARVSKPTSPSDVTLGLLKDPVLSADGGIAFAATLKGSTAKGPAAQTLWWQPPGGQPTVLAHGGTGATPIADNPGAQWKSFSSLAIAANRGPIFTATLVPGKGGITKATSNGLWATDFQGNVRLLVQAGVTQIDGKTVKSFTLLNANAGSQGSTRSFNDHAFVVWRATFTDKSQAIVKTEVP